MPRLPLLTSLGLAAALTAVSALPAAAISIGSIDTFDTDNEGWRVGNAGVQPSQQPGVSFNGQPGFLRHFSDGGGANGKWLMWTQDSDWTGNYLSAGVGSISLWADGRTGDDIVFWLGFDGPGGWHFTPGQTIVTAEDWERFEFDVTPDSLIYSAASGGTGVAADTLSSVTRFEIFAGPGPVTFAANGDLLRAGTSQNVIWFDNVAAQPIPEPASIAGLATLGLVGLGRRSRRR
ncbi:MAG: PEP-CTERM sorting domain-containing protein [Planctomycetota bacterium]